MRLFIIALAFTSVLGASSADRVLGVCLDDRVGVGARAMRAFDRELALLTEARVSARPCSTPAGIRVAIRTHAPARYRTALGLAQTSGSRVLPAIELYATNIVKALDGQVGSERFGRALARVAFHELQHYVRQDHHHDDDGLFSPALNGVQLMRPARRDSAE